MGFDAQKREAAGLIRHRDKKALQKWAAGVRNPLRVLLSLTYAADEPTRWRAVEATGWVVESEWGDNPDPVRDVVRRLFWQMNDESGGLAWHAPEMIGEMLVKSPALIAEFAALLLPFLSEAPFERGGHFAIMRIAGVDAGPFAESAPELLESLSNPDPAIRACAARTLGAMRKSSDSEALKELVEDRATYRSYDFDSGEMETRLVGDAAYEALNLMASNERAA